MKQSFSWKVIFGLFAVLLVVALLIIHLININKQVTQIAIFEKRKLMELEAV